ncbi:MAG: hypothetical protein ACKOAZ_04525 [Ilumatobacteraceae bacterium]
MGLRRMAGGGAVAAVAASLSLVTCGPTMSPADAVVPDHCVEHVPFDGSADVPGDHRCAGLALDYHVAGVDRSPSPLWAGQWLFTDDEGLYRTGWCTYHLGQHPLSGTPSSPVPQSFARDAGGRLSGYLAWRYRSTADDLTAAALWAVFHYLAGDAAGQHRADDAASALVPSLDMLAAATGRADVQARAIELLGEAQRHAGTQVPEWRLDLTVAVGQSPAEGTATVILTAGTEPVAGQHVSVLVSGGDAPHAATTGPDGSATVAVPLLPGTVTVAATTEAPGAAVVYRGTPATPTPNGAQLMVTAGDPESLTATASLEVPAASTTLPPDVPGSTVPDVTEPDATEPEADSLPVAGSSAEAWTAALAIAALVAGVGLLGTVRRPRHPAAGGSPVGAAPAGR